MDLSLEVPWISTDRTGFRPGWQAIETVVAWRSSSEVPWKYAAATPAKAAIFFDATWWQAKILAEKRLPLPMESSQSLPALSSPGWKGWVSLLAAAKILSLSMQYSSPSLSIRSSTSWTSSVLASGSPCHSLSVPPVKTTSMLRLKSWFEHWDGFSYGSHLLPHQ